MPAAVVALPRDVAGPAQPGEVGGLREAEAKVENGELRIQAQSEERRAPPVWRKTKSSLTSLLYGPNGWGRPR